MKLIIGPKEKMGIIGNKKFSVFGFGSVGSLVFNGNLEKSIYSTPVINGEDLKISYQECLESKITRSVFANSEEEYEDLKRLFGLFGFDVISYWQPKSQKRIWFDPTKLTTQCSLESLDDIFQTYSMSFDVNIRRVDIKHLIKFFKILSIKYDYKTFYENINNYTEIILM